MIKNLVLTLVLALCGVASLSAQMKGDESAVALAQEYYQNALDREAAGRHKEASVWARHAVAVYDSLVLAHRDSMLYVLPRARCNQSLAKYYYETNEGTKSMLCAQNSIRFYNLAVQIDPDTFSEERDLAMSSLYIYLSYGYLSGKKTDEAQRYINQAYELRRAFYDQDPDLHRKALFSAVRVRGMIMAQIGEFDEAHAMYSDAIGLCDEMEAAEPGTNNHNYQSIFFNIASAYYMAGDYTDALRANLKVLKLLRADETATKEDKEYYLDYCYKYIANCYWCLAYDEYVKSGYNKKSKETMALYQKAYDCYNMALQYNADDFESKGKRTMVQLILNGIEKPKPM
ncbi:MAG: hypothetical protein Q4B58_08750 [Bacteroidales bacterium]|nr:hypothetical protein [Bacteroidales bacterium]